MFDSSERGTTLGHGVLPVGYGTDSPAGKDYWAVAYSWGPNCGDVGYICVCTPAPVSFRMVQVSAGLTSS